MIIDTHVHLDSYDHVETTEKMITRLISDMQNNHVDKAVIMTATHSPEWGDKGIDEIIPLLQTRGLLNITLFLIGSVGSQFTNQEIEKLEGYLKLRIIRGIKLYPGYEEFYPFEERFKAVYELCIKYDIPCFFHCGSTYAKKAGIETAHPIHIDRVALRFPNLKIVICHIAMPWYQTCAMLMERHENVYTDISGFITPGSNSESFEIFKQALRFIKGYVGSYDKVLFGTDWIICRYEDYFRFMDTMNLNKEDRENILGKNAQKIMRF